MERKQASASFIVEVTSVFGNPVTMETGVYKNPKSLYAGNLYVLHA
jgi:hypothetical protein